MDPWQIALLVSAIAFAAFMVFKMRPAVSEGARATAAALKDAKQRIAAAKDDVARTKALGDAGDACARLGRNGAAVSFYLRALHVTPLSKEIVERAAVALAQKPGSLEKLMWRALGGAAWTDDRREAAIVALRALATAYEKKPRTQPRGRAIVHMIEVMASSRSAER
jgi:hypothetical protein